MQQQAWRPRKSVTLYDFYDNPRRQHSEVLDFGRAWRDATDGAATYSIHWIVDTGELYALRTPGDAPHPYAVPSLVRVTSRLETEGLTVELLGVFHERSDVECILAGWEEFMPLPDSLEWVRDRVAGGT